MTAEYEVGPDGSDPHTRDLIMSRPPKALVIGAAGNIGSPLVAYLRAMGYAVLEVDIRPGWRPNYLMADITHPLDLLPAFDWAPDVVFLLAAAVGRMTCEQAGSLAIATNLAGINNVLQLCKRTDSICVFFSTSEVYGPACDPMDDSTAVPQPNNRYGLSKWLAEQVIEYEVRTGKLRAVTLRPCMIYDENEVVGEHRSAMIRFASNLARGRPIEVHRGSARSWLHVSDAVRAVEAAGHVTRHATINIGHPHIMPTDDLAELIRAELAADPSLIRLTPLPPQMTLLKRPTLERQRTILGIEPLVSLQEGVRRVCAVQARMVALSSSSNGKSESAAVLPESVVAPGPNEPLLPPLKLPSAAV
jgi:nucleoside-diphosphate-sugar epimerase